MIGVDANVAYVGHEIWIGNVEACDQDHVSHELSIHIRHHKKAVPLPCRRSTNSSSEGLFLCYDDGDPLTAASVPLESIAAYARRVGRLFVHCGWGLCRSPTIALLCKVARGADPFSAMADIGRGLWEGYEAAPQFHSVPVIDILRWHTDASSPQQVGRTQNVRAVVARIEAKRAASRRSKPS